ncbi:MAG: lipopolysaccharide heptosyltransferase I [Desulfuromonadaceae bacterium]|nr:lipopolysaccharide heptosyltransferase I [Desulfuromonadaceae bacterium]MDD2848189.1 lipopolysaccharide heptosyltransferase I [Desulfuromonadaceae bacterium]MDD4130644.1 lipopolysaccharide heptosyltransferase I [Desulfuromonadaceae bacterium]
MRILIVKISAMGDVLHALPVLDYLKQASPGCEIDWVVEEAFADLLSGNPLISQLHTVRFKKWKKKPFSLETINDILNVRRGLVQRAYDLVIDIQGNIKSGMVAWVSGCSHRVGFSRAAAQESLNALFIKRRIALRPEDLHITDQYLRVAAASFDLEFSGLQLHTDICTRPEDDLAVDDLVKRYRKEGPLFLIHTGTTWQTKFWYESGWVELGRMIISTFPGAVLLFSWGNDSEYSAAERVTTALGGQAVLLEKLSIMRLAALVKKVNMVMGGDTGIIHLAAAAGTPTVSYYRSSDGLRSGPRGAQHAVIQAPMPCARCFRTRCEKDGECRESITPALLMQAIEKILC